MGKQGGIARFLGSCGGINGYVDDGRVLWRKRSSLDKRRWQTLPSMARQREAARLFGAAAKVASGLWAALPAGMRRLADGGGFNRLVGQVVAVQGEDGNVADVDGFRGLDLSVDSTGPHRVVWDRGGVALVGMDRLVAELQASGWRAGQVRREICGREPVHQRRDHA